MKRFIASVLVALSILTWVGTFATQPVFAASGSACKNSLFGIPTWYEYLPLNADCSVNTDKAGGSIAVLVTMAIIDILLFIAGFLAGFFIIYGGFKYMTSMAEPAKVGAAKTTILNAVVGLVIAILGSAIVSFIAGKLA